MSTANNEITKKRNLEGYGLKIKKYRKDKGMTAEELAKALRVTVSSIRNWECGISRPDPEYLYRMFSVLDVSPNEFFDIQGAGTSLSAEERNVVNYYRSMDANGRNYYLTIGAAMAKESHTMKLREAKGKIIPLPSFGRYAAAGAGDYWSSDTTEKEDILLYSSPLVSEADEIVTVSGHSMEPNYHDHDRVLVKYCTETEIGKVYIFSVRGMGLFIKEAGKDRLHSQNEEYADIVPWEEDGAELIGRVIGIINASMCPSDEECENYYEAIQTLKD